MAKKTQQAQPAAADVVIPSGPRATNAGQVEIAQIKIADVRIRNKKDRTRDEAFNASVRELAASIAQVGLQQPICVEPLGHKGEKGYELVFGERRLLACQILKLEEIPAVILLGDQADRVLEIRAAENFQRADLNDDQKALVVCEMVDREVEKIRNGNTGESWDDPRVTDAVRTQAVKAVAERLGWPVPRVRDYAFVGELPPKTRALVAAGRLSLLHAKVLAQVADAGRCDELAAYHAAGEDPAAEPMKPLDDLRDRVQKECSRLDGVPWDLDAKFAGAQACNACTHNSRNQTGLFEGTLTGKYNYGSNGPLNEKLIGPDGPGICMKLECFRAKNAAAKTAIRSAGDRIAGKVAKVGTKERSTEVGRLVREATEKASFVRPTVFGKLVKERIEDKLEAATKKAKPEKAGGGITHSYDSPEEKAKRAAKQKFKDAQRKWLGAVFKLLENRLKGQPVTRMLVAIVTCSNVFSHGRVFWHETPKELKKKAEARRDAGMLLVTAAKAGSRLESDADLKKLAASESEELTITQWQFEDLGEHLIDLLRALGEDSDIADPPKWDDFDPANKAKSPEKPDSSEKPKGSDASRAPAKAGKKKSKMSKGKPAKAAAVDADDADEGEE